MDGPLFLTRYSNARHKRRTTRPKKKITSSSSQKHSSSFSVADEDQPMETLVITRSTQALEETARACEYGLTHPTPPLERVNHVAFLTAVGLRDLLPRKFTSLDASRPWMMYWVLCALKTLGEDIAPHRQRYAPIYSRSFFRCSFSALFFVALKLTSVGPFQVCGLVSIHRAASAEATDSLLTWHRHMPP